MNITKDRKIRDLEEKVRELDKRIAYLERVLAHDRDTERAALAPIMEELRVSTEDLIASLVSLGNPRDRDESRIFAAAQQAILCRQRAEEG